MKTKVNYERRKQKLLTEHRKQDYAMEQINSIKSNIAEKKWEK